MFGLGAEAVERMGSALLSLRKLVLSEALVDFFGLSSMSWRRLGYEKVVPGMV